MTHPRRSLGRWSTLLASRGGAVLFTWAVACATTHLRLVEHDICREHGALVERTGAQARHATAHASPSDREAPDQAAPSTHDDHDLQKHCSLLLLTAVPTSAVPVDQLAPLVYPLVGPAAQFSALPAKREPLCRLDLAPKTSPPVA